MLSSQLTNEKGRRNAATDRLIKVDVEAIPLTEIEWME